MSVEQENIEALDDQAEARTSKESNKLKRQQIVSGTNSNGLTTQRSSVGDIESQLAPGHRKKQTPTHSTINQPAMIVSAGASALDINSTAAMTTSNIADANSNTSYNVAGSNSFVNADQRKHAMLQLRPMSSHKNQNGLNTKISPVQSAAKSVSPNQREENKGIGKPNQSRQTTTQGGENIQIRIKQMGKHIMFREDRSKLMSAGGLGLNSKKPVAPVKTKNSLKNSQHPQINTDTQESKEKLEIPGDLTPSMTGQKSTNKTKKQTGKDARYFTKQNFWPAQQSKDGNASPVMPNTNFDQFRPTHTAHGQRPKTNYKQRQGNGPPAPAPGDRKNSLIKFNIEGIYVEEYDMIDQHQRGLSQNQPVKGTALPSNESSILYPQFQQEQKQRSTVYGMGFFSQEPANPKTSKQSFYNPYQDNSNQMSQAKPQVSQQFQFNNNRAKVDLKQLPQIAMRNTGHEFFQSQVQPAQQVSGAGQLSNAYAQAPQGYEMLRENKRSTASRQFRQNPTFTAQAQKKVNRRQNEDCPQSNSLVYKSMENAIPMKFGVGEYFPTPRAQKGNKPRAANINISNQTGPEKTNNNSIEGKTTKEVIQMKISREQGVKDHLQREQQSNMNLLFYDFNNSSLPDERAKTGSNFYQPERSNLHKEEVVRDRLPTRDSKSRDVGHRSIVSSNQVKRTPLNNEETNVSQEPTTAKQQSHSIGPSPHRADQIMNSQRKKISQQQQRHKMRLGSPNPGSSLGLSLSLKKKRAMLKKQKEEGGPVIHHIYNYQNNKHGRISPATFKSKNGVTSATASTSATSGISHSTGIEETQYSTNSVFDKKDSIQGNDGNVESIQEWDSESEDDVQGVTPRQFGQWQNKMMMIQPTKSIQEDIQESDEEVDN